MIKKPIYLPDDYNHERPLNASQYLRKKLKDSERDNVQNDWCVMAFAFVAMFYFIIRLLF